jgi:flagellin
VTATSGAAGAVTLSYVNASGASFTVSGSGVVSGLTSATFSPVTTTSGTISIDGVTVNIASGSSVSDVAAAINAYTTQTGVSASGGGGKLQLTDSTGADISAVGTGGISFVGSTTYSAGIELYTALGSSNTITIGGDSGTLSAIGLSGTGVNFGSLTSLSLNSTDVLTYSGAKQAIKTMDFALSQLSRLGGQLGAIQSRFQGTISNLQSAATNTTAARSRIQDADFAAETANLSQAQILQQAGVAMVAQANAMPQLALSLLK